MDESVILLNKIDEEKTDRLNAEDESKSKKSSSLENEQEKRTQSNTIFTPEVI